MTMKKYARIQDGKVAEIFETDGRIEELFHPCLVWVECGQTVSVGDGYDGVAFVPAVVSAGSIGAPASWGALQAEALGALAESDITVLRCAEAGVPVPQSWRDYRAALRLIVSSAAGDPDAGLPPRPDYPPGT